MNATNPFEVTVPGPEITTTGPAGDHSTILQKIRAAANILMPGGLAASGRQRLAIQWIELAPVVVRIQREHDASPHHPSPVGRFQ